MVISVFALGTFQARNASDLTFESSTLSSRIAESATRHNIFVRLHLATGYKWPNKIIIIIVTIPNSNMNSSFTYFYSLLASYNPKHSLIVFHAFALCWKENSTGVSFFVRVMDTSQWPLVRGWGDWRRHWMFPPVFGAVAYVNDSL